MLSRFIVARRTVVPLIRLGDGYYHSIGRTSVRTRHKALASCWYHISCRGLRFDAESLVHDAPFVGKAEDEEIVAWPRTAFGHALDQGSDLDLSVDIRPEALFCCQT